MLLHVAFHVYLLHGAYCALIIPCCVSSVTMNSAPSRVQRPCILSKFGCWNFLQCKFIITCWCHCPNNKSAHVWHYLIAVTASLMNWSPSLVRALSFATRIATFLIPHRPDITYYCACKNQNIHMHVWMEGEVPTSITLKTNHYSCKYSGMLSRNDQITYSILSTCKLPAKGQLRLWDFQFYIWCTKT